MFLKRCFILIISLVCFLPLKSQGTYESIITLYFEDNAGRKDTITFGMSDSATVDIDSAFNEVNIYGTPLDSLDIRIIQRDTNNYECIGNYLNSTPNNTQFFTTNRDLKTDIRDINFTSNYGYYGSISGTFEIALRNVEFPIKVKCQNTSFINSAFHGWSTFYALDSNCVGNMHYGLYNLVNSYFNDSIIIYDSTITNFIFLFDHEISINEFNTTPSWKIQPNPAQSNITLSDANTFNGKIEILNLLGEIVLSETLFENNNPSINVEQLKNGVYFIRYYDNETKTYSTNKLIKN